MVKFAVFDEKLVTRFHLLGDTDSGIVSTPPVFIAFDVLQPGSRALRSFPLADRRRTVEELLDDVSFVSPVARGMPLTELVNTVSASESDLVVIEARGTRVCSG